jgi:hypothetical protein
MQQPKKFGLIVKKKPSLQPKPQRTVLSNAFASVAEEEPEQPPASSAKSSHRRDVERASAAIISKHDLPELSKEEAALYDYDGTYESSKQAVNSMASKLSQGSNSLRGGKEPKSRYVANLKATAEVRNLAKDRTFERLLLKEREKEDAEFGDKPKFITSAYKAKLIEQQKWQAEEVRLEKLEAKSDVRSSGMAGFYSNLMTRNVAAGADVAKVALSAYTAGGIRQEKLLGEREAATAAADAADAPQPPTWEPESPGGKRRQPPSDYAEYLAIAESPSKGAASPRKGAGCDPSALPDEAGQSPGADESESEQRAGGGAGSGAKAPIPRSLPPATSADKIQAVVDKSSAILSARERFLHRKRQKVASAEETTGA